MQRNLRCTAVLLDCTVPDPKPEVVEFEHDGPWFEALDMVHTHYSAVRKGGRLIDAERVELLSFVAIRKEVA